MVKSKPNRFIIFNMGALMASICFMILVLSGCGASISSRNNLADKITAHDTLSRQQIYAAPFYVTAYMSAYPSAKIGRVYIEGDGLAWISKTRPSLNPTPIDPYALRLAEVDNNRNVDRVYLARPCQYTGWDGKGACPMKYWTTHRYAPEVVDAYARLLRSLVLNRGWDGVELVGYSGGGTLALLLARSNRDVMSVRTVAGNVDIDAHSRFHGVDLMPNSINPAKYATELRAVPQLHFVGGQDKVVPMDVVESYHLQMGAQSCSRANLISGLSHEKGWIEHWPDLLHTPLPC